MDRNLAYWADMFPDIKKDIEKLEENNKLLRQQNTTLKQNATQYKKLLSDKNKQIQILTRQLNQFKLREKNRKEKLQDTVLSDFDLWTIWQNFIDAKLPDYRDPHLEINNPNIEYISAVSNVKYLTEFQKHAEAILRKDKQFDKRLRDFDTLQQLLIRISFTKM